jgi:hypothetical protein
MTNPGSDEQLRRGRLGLAWLTTPLVAILALTGIASGYAVMSGELRLREWLGASGHALFFLTLFGAPIAYLIELLIGFPTYVLMRRHGGVRLAGVLGASVFAGMLGLALLVIGRSWQSGDTAAVIIGGGGCGSVAGLWFWWVAFARDRSAQGAA